MTIPGVGTIADSAGGTFTVNAQAAQVYYSAQGTAAGNRTFGTHSITLFYTIGSRITNMIFWT